MLSGLANWLGTTGLSQSIQTISWVIPTLQSLHILALAVVMAAVWMFDLRVLGLAGTDQRLSELTDRFLPWVWGAVVALAVTGALLVIGEPLALLTHWMFQLKMALLALAIVVTLGFQHTVRRNRAAWDVRPVRVSARVTALVSLLLWVAIAFAGRWIAYT